MTDSLPRLLVIDERLARNEDERQAFMNATDLACEGSKEAASKSPIALVAFSSGQVKDRSDWKNNYPTIKAAVEKGGNTQTWALVLLNARFKSEPSSDSDDRFGEEVYHQLADQFPDVPVVQFTSKPQKKLSHDVGHRYLHKSSLDRRTIAECLLRNGRITPEQTRALLGLNQKTIAESPLSLQLFTDAYVHADEDSPVLLLGESGVGKEVVANYIHRHSHRQNSAFVAYNMTAIPKELAESILFGHEKGSFTGATENRQGLFEQADKGTLFLDEIGDMSFELQAKLLRAIQEGEVRRIGSAKATKVSVRLICATSANLAQAMAEGRFRRDLYYRLAGVPLSLPPLRERPADIAPLAASFLGRYQKDQNKDGIEFSQQALDALSHHPFLGNVRELEQLVQRLVGRTGDGRVISESEVRAELARTVQPGSVPILVPATNIPASSSIAILGQLIAAIDGFTPRMDDPDFSGVKLKLEMSMRSLLGRLAEVALTRFRRQDGGDNVTSAMSLLAGESLTGAQARQMREGIGRDQGAERDRSMMPEVP